MTRSLEFKRAVYDAAVNIYGETECSTFEESITDDAFDDLCTICEVMCRTAATPVIPEGWQLVPKELTDNEVDRMLSARIPGGSSARDWFLPHELPKGLANVRDVVRAMLAAAPKPPTNEGEE